MRLRQVFNSFRDICDHPGEGLIPAMPQPPPQSLLQTHFTSATNEFEARPTANEHAPSARDHRKRKEEDTVRPSSFSPRFLVCAPIC